jgi:hypothetical protein
LSFFASGSDIPTTAFDDVDDRDDDRDDDDDDDDHWVTGRDDNRRAAKRVSTGRAERIVRKHNSKKYGARDEDIWIPRSVQHESMSSARDESAESDALSAGGGPPLVHSLVAGGCAAVASRVFTLPPDTIKARQQVSSIYKGTADAFVKIVRHEGVRGLYPGFLPLLLTVVPANMCYFGGYELGKRITPHHWGPGRDMATAVIAQSLAGVAYCPIDIVKQTVQTATVVQGGESKMANPWHAARTIWNAQGVKGFYRGFVAMNCLWMPWNLIYLSLYEAGKRTASEYRQHDGSGAGPGSGASWRYVRDEGGEHGVEVYEVDPRARAVELPLWSYPLCSSVAAAAAALVTHPIDCIKTNMQVLSAQTGRRQPASAIARELWHSRGLMKGWSGTCLLF